jgi:formate dehydrogenase subunit gamma
MSANRFLALLLLLGAFIFNSLPVSAQAIEGTRAATGGAQTLSDIMARQRGEASDDSYRREAIGTPEGAAAMSDQLGTLGGVSDPELWRAFRYGTAEIKSSTNGPAATTVIQDGGMRWLELRRGVVPQYGGYLMLGMLVVLVLFYLLRGRIMIEGEKTGETIMRFKLLERIAHWAMAIPFLLLGVTGLLLLFGRTVFIPLFGRSAFSTIAVAGKFVHNYIAWVFMAGLILSFLLWAWKNLPDRHDIPWLLKGGGLFSKGVHPSAGKFNAGEKIIFWTVIGLGVLISLTGLSLIFPYELQFFGSVHQFANTLGLPQMLGYGALDTALAPQEEMQLAQIWHVVIAFVFMSIIIAHIYLGSVGMEGALDSMTKGTVDVQWAKEHHDLWYEEMTSETASTEKKAAQT